MPCGQCLACRLARASEWATRCLHEKAYHDRSTFATLTYSDDQLPRDGSLDHDEFTKFWKRLRKAAGERKLRYYGCGEYGERYGRPHYHAIIFGVGPWEKGLVSLAWGHGAVHLGTVTHASIRYTADYVGKAVQGKKGRAAYSVLTGEAYGERVRPFAVMSMGLGRAFVDEHGPLFLSKGVTVNGRRVPVPRYYKARLTKEVQLLDDLWFSPGFVEPEYSAEELRDQAERWWNRDQVEKTLRARSTLSPKGYM